MRPDTSTLILSRSDVAQLLPIDDCIEAVEAAFAAHARGEAKGPEVATVHVDGGGFHVKAAALGRERCYFAAKTNGNFFHNERLQLPRIQGTIALCDATNGVPLAVLDSIEVTILRTAAATAVAARHLALAGSRRLALVGCGVQGHASWRALKACFPIDEVFLFDIHPEAAESLANKIGTSASVLVCGGISDALRNADICVTSTPSTSPIVMPDHVHPGLFIAAVGADSSAKQEIAPAVLQSSRVVVDSREQALTIGDTRHAVDASHPPETLVAATLGEVITRQKEGRRSKEDVVVFDSTGTALQDVAAAALVYERAVRAARGIRIDFSA